MNEVLDEPDELYEALTAWSYYMKNVEKFAFKTMEGKFSEASKLTAWLADKDLISTREITATLVAGYTIDRYGHLADQTYNLYLGHLRSYLTFLRKKKLLGDDQAPESDLKPRRRPASKRPKEFVYPHELMETAEKAARWHDRDKYFLLFAFYGARRAGEVCALRWADIDLTPRPRYKFGSFRFRNNKIGGEIKPRPIDRLLLPYVLEWQIRYQELLNERFGFHSDGRPKRKLRSTDWVFPALRVGPGMSSGGARRALVLVPDKFTPYGSIKKSLRRAGVKGVHSLRRGGMVGLDQRFDLVTAQVMADHKTPEQAAAYLDMDLKAEAVGDQFAKEADREAKKKLKKARKAAAKAGLPSLADRREKARRAS